MVYVDEAVLLCVMISQFLQKTYQYISTTSSEEGYQVNDDDDDDDDDDTFVVLVVFANELLIPPYAS